MQGLLRDALEQREIQVLFSIHFMHIDKHWHPVSKNGSQCVCVFNNLRYLYSFVKPICITLKHCCTVARFCYLVLTCGNVMSLSLALSMWAWSADVTFFSPFHVGMECRCQNLFKKFLNSNIIYLGPTTFWFRMTNILKGGFNIAWDFGLFFCWVFCTNMLRVVQFS